MAVHTSSFILRPTHRPTLRRLNCVSVASVVFVFIHIVFWASVFGAHYRMLAGAGVGSVRLTGAPVVFGMIVLLTTGVYLFWFDLACKHVLASKSPDRLGIVPCVGAVVVAVLTIFWSFHWLMALPLVALCALSVVFVLPVKGTYIYVRTRVEGARVPMGISHEHYLEHSLCAQCNYQPGPSPTITVCPECGCSEFSLLVEPRAAQPNP